MCSKRRRIVALLCLLLVVGSLTPVVATSTANMAPTQDRVEGASIPLREPSEQNYLNQSDEIAKKFGIDAQMYTNAFFLAQDGTNYLVFSKESEKVARATVTGVTLSPSELEGNDFGVIFASDVKYDTDGKPVSLSKLRENPEQYRYQLVQVKAPYRSLAIAADASSHTRQDSFGLLGASQSPFTLSNPGQIGRWAVLNVSNSKYGGTPSKELKSQLGPRNGGVAVQALGPRFSVNATATVDAIVMTDGFSGGVTPYTSSPGLLVSDVSFPATQIDSVSEIHKQGAELEGEVVTTTVQGVGTRTSSKEFLLSAAQCAPDSVSVPVAPGCVPVVTDTVTHAGVLYTQTPTSTDEVVGFIGLSNHKQETVTKPIHGTYQVTGRVVTTSQVDSSLPDGYAIIIYDMERKGDLRISATGIAESYQKKVQNAIQQSLNTSAQETTTIEIVSRSLTKKTVGPNEAAAIRVKLENTGATDGTKTIEIRAAGGVQSKSKSVHVTAGSTKTVEIQFDPTWDAGSGYQIRVNGEDTGLLTVEKRDGSGSTDIVVRDTRLGATEIDSGASTLVQATVENTGSTAGTIELELTADGEVVERKSVRVKAGQSKEVDFVFSSDSDEKVTLAVNDQEVGTVVVGNPPLIPPGMRTVLAGGFLGIGGILLISGFITEVLRLGKKHLFGRQPTTTEKQVNIVSAVGFVLLIPGSYFFGIDGGTIAVVFGGIVGLVAFFTGWKWAFKNI